MSCRLSMAWRCSEALEKAVTAIGTFWMFSSTRWAVTTSSDTSVEGASAAAAPPANARRPTVRAAHETP